VENLKYKVGDYVIWVSSLYIIKVVYDSTFAISAVGEVDYFMVRVKEWEIRHAPSVIVALARM
jgi:hypothetical protein